MVGGSAGWEPAAVTSIGLPQAAPQRGLRAFAAEIAPAARTGRLPRVLAFAAAAGVAVLVASHGRVFADALGRAAHASWSLVLVGAVLEAASVAGYVLLFHRVVSATSPRLRLRDSYDITLAGTAATRLLPTAGLGGAAVTVWALRAHGVRPREIAQRVVGFLLILYAVYMGALVVSGAALALDGRTLGLLGVALGTGIAALAVLALAAPRFVTRALERGARRPGRIGTAAAKLERELPTLRGSLALAARELRRPHPALLGALAWWGFDMGVLYTMLAAFGHTPAPATLVLAYFLGTMFNLLPLPGTLSGGLAGMLIALGTPAGAALAAVLAYRAVAVWGPAAWGVPSVGRLRASVAAWRGAAIRT
jgi:uncharacterized membrane protein YbhN (UPF0104 family)